MVSKKLIKNSKLTPCVVDLLIAQNGNCIYCGKPLFTTSTVTDLITTKDHFYPKREGNSLAGNTVLAHKICNCKKGCNTPTLREQRLFDKTIVNLLDMMEKRELLSKDYKDRGRESLDSKTKPIISYLRTKKTK